LYGGPGFGNVSGLVGAGRNVSSAEIESMLSKLWAETLGVARVDADENFFELGGDSLLATRVMARLRSDYGVEMSPEMLFDLPTVRELALAVESLVNVRS
jgi:acyl carrier protein